jgi:hypothetical protein
MILPAASNLSRRASASWAWQRQRYKTVWKRLNWKRYSNRPRRVFQAPCRAACHVACHARRCLARLFLVASILAIKSKSKLLLLRKLHRGQGLCLESQTGMDAADSAGAMGLVEEEVVVEEERMKRWLA